MFLSQLAVWDTESDAREFFDAYVKRTELRYPDAKRIDSAGSQQETRNQKLETGLSYSWQTSEGKVVIELRGLRVAILEGVPDGVEPSTLMTEFRLLSAFHDLGLRTKGIIVPTTFAVLI